MQLGKVADYVRGITFKPTDLVDVGSPESIVCMRTKNVQHDLDETDLIAVPSVFVKREEQYLSEGDLLVSSANSWNLVGKCSYVPRLSYRAAAGGFISILRPKIGLIEPRYLYHWLASGRTQHLARLCGRRTTNISNLDRERFLSLEIPVPTKPDGSVDLGEQRRIATTLDKADAIHRKRNETIHLTEELLCSTFLEMFGDPVTNPKGWRMSPLAKGLQEIVAGWSAKGESRRVRDSEMGVLKVSAVTKGRYRALEHKAVDGSIARDLVIPKRGDLLFSRANTRDLVAAACIVTVGDSRVFLPDKLWRIDTDTTALLPEFLLYCLRQPRYRFLLTSRATGTSGSMLNISQKKVSETLTPFPPISLQHQFRQIFWRVMDLEHSFRLGSTETEGLFGSLVQRAFRGEL